MMVFLWDYQAWFLANQFGFLGSDDFKFLMRNFLVSSYMSERMLKGKLGTPKWRKVTSLVLRAI